MSRIDLPIPIQQFTDKDLDNIILAYEQSGMKTLPRLREMHTAKDIIKTIQEFHSEEITPSFFTPDNKLIISQYDKKVAVQVIPN
jgi:16S rRNA U1498 N3-methylase RsmE